MYKCMVWSTVFIQMRVVHINLYLKLLVDNYTNDLIIINKDFISQNHSILGQFLLSSPTPLQFPPKVLDFIIALSSEFVTVWQKGSTHKM